MSRPLESVWDYPRPPRVEPDDRTVRIVHRDLVIAESASAVRVLETSHPPAFYLPPEDVNMEYLTLGRGRSICEWKGNAEYWDLIVGNDTVPNAGLELPETARCLRHAGRMVVVLPGSGRRMHRRRRSGHSPGGRFLRRLDHERDRGPVQGSSGHLRLVAQRPHAGITLRRPCRLRPCCSRVLTPPESWPPLRRSCPTTAATSSTPTSTPTPKRPGSCNGSNGSSKASTSAEKRSPRRFDRSPSGSKWTGASTSPMSRVASLSWCPNRGTACSTSSLDGASANSRRPSRS